MLSFDEIPYDWKKPGNFTEVRPVYDNMGLAGYPARAIIVTQKLASGSAIPGQLYPITSPDQGKAFFGVGSIGAEQVRYYKLTNKTTEVFALALEDAGAGVASTKTITFVGTPTIGGTIPLYIESDRIPLVVTAGQAVAAIATAAAATINALADCPFTAVAAAGVVTLTARQKGECGNHYSVRVARRIGDTLPAGTTVTVASGVAGANNPDVQTALDAIATEWFTDFCFPWDDATNLGKIAADLNRRFGAMTKLDAVAYVGHRGTYAELVTKGGLTNCPHLTGMGAKNSPTAPHKWAAAISGLASFHFANDPARQLRSLVLTGVEAPDPADCFLESEQNLLLGKGISTFNRLPDGSVTIDRLVSTYKVSNLNVADYAWLDIMVSKVASRIRYDWGSYCTLTYPRSKLADDGSVAATHAANVVTPRRVWASWAARCKIYEMQGWIEQSTETVKQSIFERDVSDKNRLNSRLRIRIIGNLMVLAGALEFEV